MAAGDSGEGPYIAVNLDVGRLWCIFLFVTLLALVLARPQEFEDEDEGQIADKRDDIQRVQIKVYRGPTKHDGYAPWGFWVKQPSDNE